MADEQEQTVRYRLTVDPSDVHSSIAEIQASADRAASSVTAMASNLLSTLRSVASDSFGVTQNAARDMASMMYASAPRPSMMQMGPSMVGPTGMPTIDLFRPGAYGGGYQYQFPYTPSTAPYFAPPVSPLLHPDSPMVQAQARSLFSRGEGGLGNIGQTVYRMIMRAQGGIAGTSNLDESVYETMERRSEAFGRNAANFMLGDMPGLAMTAAGFAIGGPLGAGLGLAAFGAGLPLRAVQHFARPYSEGADLFREKTAPYVQGGRLGNGLSLRETIDFQGRLMKMSRNDKYFTAKDYRDIIEMSGDTGVFQFTGSQKQAEQAIEKMAENVKTLHALGVKSRDMLKSLDKLMGGFGINIGTDSQSVANIATAAAITGRMAGVDTATAMERAQSTAQQFASQGLHPTFGGRLGLLNAGIAGAISRSGMGAGFIASYYGGQQGLEDSLNASYGAMMRTPFGQMQMLARYGAGMRGPMTVPNMMGSLGALAGNPYEFLAQQTFMPWLTKKATGTDALEMMRDQLGMLKGMTGQTDARVLLGLLKQINPGVDVQAIALQLAGAKDVSANMRRQIMDQQNLLSLEARRTLGLDRTVEKFKEQAFAPVAGVGMWVRDLGAGFGERYEEFMTGRESVNLGRAGLVGLDPMKARDQVKMEAQLRDIGFRLPEYGIGTKEERENLNTRSAVNYARRMYRDNGLFAGELERRARIDGNSDLLNLMHADPVGMTNEQRNRQIKIVNEEVAKFEKAQERNFDTMRGMSEWNKLTFNNQDLVRKDVGALMANSSIRGQVMSALRKDSDVSLEGRMLGLKQALFGKSNLSDEEGERFGQMLMALDVGGMGSEEGWTLNSIRKNLPKLVENRGFVDAKALKEERDEMIRGFGNDSLNSTGSMSNWGVDNRGVLRSAKDTWLKAGPEGTRMVEQSMVMGLARRTLAQNNKTAFLRELRQARGFKSDADALQSLGLDPNANATQLFNQLAGRFQSGGKWDKLAQSEGFSLDDVVNLGEAASGNFVDNMKKIQKIGVNENQLAEAASQGANINFGVQFAAALKMAPGYDPDRLKELENNLGGKSVEKYLGEATSETDTFERLKKLSLGMRTSGVGRGFIDDETLKSFANAKDASDFLQNVAGFSKDQVDKMKDEERSHLAASWMRDRLAPQSYDQRVAMNQAGPMMAGSKEVAGMRAAMGDLSASMSVLSDITKDIDTSKLEGMLKAMESAGSTYEGKDTSVGTMTVNVDNLTILEKGEKRAEGTIGAANTSTKPLDPKTTGQGNTNPASGSADVTL